MTSTKVKSTNKGIYAVQHLGEHALHASPLPFCTPRFTLRLTWAKRPLGTVWCQAGPTGSRKVHPTLTSSRRGLPSTAVQVLQALLVWGRAEGSAKQVAFSCLTWHGEMGSQLHPALVYHHIKNFSLYSSVRL